MSDDERRDRRRDDAPVPDPFEGPAWERPSRRTGRRPRPAGPKRRIRGRTEAGAARSAPALEVHEAAQRAAASWSAAAIVASRRPRGRRPGCSTRACARATNWKPCAPRSGSCAPQITAGDLDAARATAKDAPHARRRGARPDHRAGVGECGGPALARQSARLGPLGHRRCRPARGRDAARSRRREQGARSAVAAPGRRQHRPDLDRGRRAALDCRAPRPWRRRAPHRTAPRPRPGSAPSTRRAATCSTNCPASGRTVDSADTGRATSCRRCSARTARARTSSASRTRRSCAAPAGCPARSPSSTSTAASSTSPSFESDTTLGRQQTGLDFGTDYDRLWSGANPTDDYRDSNVSPNFPYAAQVWVGAVEDARPASSSTARSPSTRRR